MLKTFTFVSILTAVVFCPVAFGMADVENKPNPKVDYVAKLNEIGRAGRDESLNAAGYYEKAFELCVEQPEQLSLSHIQSWPEDLPKEKQILLQNWVSANSKTLEQLKLGSPKNYYWPKYEGNSIWDISPASLRKAKILTLVLCTRAKLNTTRGNLRASISDLLVCYKFGTHFAGPKMLVEQLAGTAFRANAVQAGFEILDKVDPDPCLLEDFQQKLQVLSTDESYTLDFISTRFGFYDAIQMVFTDDGKGDGRIPEGEVEHVIRSFAGMRFVPPETLIAFKNLKRRESIELADALYEYFNEVRHKTPWQLHNEGKDDLWEVIEQIAAKNPFVLILTPNVGGVLDVFCRSKVGTDALATTLGLLRYKADKGEYPATLQRLVTAGYLRKLPMDPYSDKPLVYKRTKDNFILYSVGADFDDDGGVRSNWGKGKEGGDQVFWPVDKKTVE